MLSAARLLGELEWLLGKRIESIHRLELSTPHCGAGPLETTVVLRSLGREAAAIAVRGTSVRASRLETPEDIDRAIAHTAMDPPEEDEAILFSEAIVRPGWILESITVWMDSRCEEDGILGLALAPVSGSAVHALTSYHELELVAQDVLEAELATLAKNGARILATRVSLYRQP